MLMIGRCTTNVLEVDILLRTKYISNSIRVLLTVLPSRTSQQWVITYLDIPGFGGTNRYSSPHS